MCLSIWHSDQGLLLFFKFLSCFWMGCGGSSDLQFQVRDKRRKEIHKNSQISTLGDDLVLKPKQSNCTRNKPCPLVKRTSVPPTAIEDRECHSPGKVSGRLKCTELATVQNLEARHGGGGGGGGCRGQERCLHFALGPQSFSEY